MFSEDAVFQMLFGAAPAWCPASAGLARRELSGIFALAKITASFGKIASERKIILALPICLLLFFLFFFQRALKRSFF
jgi:hypothetical protein